MEGEIISSKTVFKGKYIKVHLDEILLPDGRPHLQERVDVFNGVRVVPIILDEYERRKDKIILIDQYICGSNEYHLGLPGGQINFDQRSQRYTETPKKAALRELFEETGYKAKKLDLLYHRKRRGTVINDIYYYLATGAYKSNDPRHIDEDEPLLIKEFFLEEAVRMARNLEFNSESTNLMIMIAYDKVRDIKANKL